MKEKFLSFEPALFGKKRISFHCYEQIKNMNQNMYKIYKLCKIAI